MAEDELQDKPRRLKNNNLIGKDFSGPRNGRFKDITGQRFGKLLAVEFVGSRTYPKLTKKGNFSKHTVWRCVCDCGREKNILRNSLVSGGSTSCGCVRRTAGGEATRGKVTPEYQTWINIIKRCHSPNNRAYQDYGGRGIKVCDRWRSSFTTFLADVGRRPSAKQSLDRIDNDRGYEPGNVRWATAFQQIHNRRPQSHCKKGHLLTPETTVWRKSGKQRRCLICEKGRSAMTMARNDPFAVVRQFEGSIAEYTGARFAVTTTSCTSALLLALLWHKKQRGPLTIHLPRYTYVGVGMSVLNAGHKVAFKDEVWVGEYRLEPLPLWDSARRLTSGMFRTGEMQCLSFHWSKHLGIQQGGCILLDDPEADAWLRRARFDGRREGVHPKDDTFDMIGHHCYMAGATAAEGLVRLSFLPRENPDLPWDDYPDLSQQPIFQRRDT